MKQLFRNFIGTFISLIFMLGMLMGINYDYSIQIGVLGIGLLLLGIPHGAGDMIISEIESKKKNTPFSKVKFYLGYLGAMSLYGITWWINPMLAFIIFILISIFHFGELEEMFGKTIFQSILLKSIIGALVLGILILSHWKESIIILEEMNLSRFIPLNFPYEKINFILIFILFYISLFIKNPVLFNTFFSLIIGIFLPLILAFTIYFVACHSYNSIRKVQFFTKFDYWALFKKLSPFSLATFFLFILYWNFIGFDKLLITNVFIFISIITFPHFFIMHKMLAEIQES